MSLASGLAIAHAAPRSCRCLDDQGQPSPRILVFVVLLQVSLQGSEREEDGNVFDSGTGLVVVVV